MENINTTTFDAVLNKFRYTRHDVSDIADFVGVIDRDTYVTLITDWKAALAEQVAAVRHARSLRKGGNEQGTGGYWNSVRQARRSEGNSLMAIRKGIKEIGRRHWERKASLEAA